MVAGEDSQNCGLTIQVWNDDAQIKELEQQPEAVEAAAAGSAQLLRFWSYSTLSP